MLLRPCLLLFALWCLLCLGFQPLSRATGSSSGSHSSQLPQNTRLPWHSGAAAMCVPLCTGTSCSALCLTCLRTSSMALFPSCHLLPRVKKWNVSFSLKNVITLRNWILIYWNKMYVSFHYRSPRWKIKGEITHYGRTTVAFTLKARSKRLCNYRGWDKWDFWDIY